MLCRRRVSARPIGKDARDHGPLPYRSAYQLVIAGQQTALIGGYGPEYDLLAPPRVTTAEIPQNGTARRPVRPDGLEI